MLNGRNILMVFDFRRRIKHDATGVVFKRWYFTNLIFRQALVTSVAQQRAPSCLHTCRVECPSVTSLRRGHASDRSKQKRPRLIIIPQNKTADLRNRCCEEKHGIVFTQFCVYGTITPESPTATLSQSVSSGNETAVKWTIIPCKVYSMYSK